MTISPLKVCHKNLQIFTQLRNPDGKIIGCHPTSGVILQELILNSYNTHNLNRATCLLYDPEEQAYVCSLDLLRANRYLFGIKSNMIDPNNKEILNADSLDYPSDRSSLVYLYSIKDEEMAKTEFKPYTKNPSNLVALYRVNAEDDLEQFQHRYLQPQSGQEAIWRQPRKFVEKTHDGGNKTWQSKSVRRLQNNAQIIYHSDSNEDTIFSQYESQPEWTASFTKVMPMQVWDNSGKEIKPMNTISSYFSYASLENDPYNVSASGKAGVETISVFDAFVGQNVDRMGPTTSNNTDVKREHHMFRIQDVPTARDDGSKGADFYATWQTEYSCTISFNAAFEEVGGSDVAGHNPDISRFTRGPGIAQQHTVIQKPASGDTKTLLPKMFQWKLF